MGSQFGGRRIVPDKTMAVVFGRGSMKPSELTKKFFSYIKRKGLLKGRYVVADANLRPLIGGGRQQTFKAIKNLWKYIKRHKLLK